MSDELLTVEQWLQVRKDAAGLIDPVTAFLAWDVSETFDPYGIGLDLPPSHRRLRQTYFVRNAGAQVWVHVEDCSEATRAVLHERITAEPVPHVDEHWELQREMVGRIFNEPQPWKVLYIGNNGDTRAIMRKYASPAILAIEIVPALGFDGSPVLRRDYHRHCLAFIADAAHHYGGEDRIPWSKTTAEIYAEMHT